MKVGSQFALFIIACALFAMSQDQGPATSPQNAPSAPQTQPDNSTSPAQPQTPATQTPPSAQEKQASPTSQASPSGKSPHAGAKKTAPKRSKLQKKPAAQTGRTVVRNGGTRDNQAQLAPAMTQEQQRHDRENTARLLSTTDANLKSVEGRRLSPTQQSMLDQIRTYVRQAKEASDSGDLTRAHTLAYKAQLLSDDLAGK